MTCDRAREWLSAREDGALAPDEEVALAAHLAACAACATHARTLAALVGVLRGPAARAAGAPAEVRAHLEATFAAAPVRSRARRRRWAGVVAGCAVAAAAGVLLAWWTAPAPGLALEAVDGAVEIVRAGGTEAAVPAPGPGALAAGDIVRTRAGTARLHLGRGARARLGPQAVLRVGRRPDAAFLGRGAAAFEVPAGQGDLRVETPAGAVEVTGTAFRVEIVSVEKEDDAMKRVTIGALSAAAAGAVVALVQVSRGSVALQGSEGAAVTVEPGESGQLTSGRPAERAPGAGGGAAPAPGAGGGGGRPLADRLAAQNAALRAEIERARGQLARQQAGAAALPTRATVQTSPDPVAPLTGDERKLLGAANLQVGAETRDELAALYQQVHGRAAPADLDERTLARELLRDLQMKHTPALKTGRSVDELIAAGVPATAARAMEIIQQRNRRMIQELERTLPPARAAAVARTVRARTTVGSYDGHEEVDMEQDVPPAEGEPLPPPAAKEGGRP